MAEKHTFEPDYFVAPGATLKETLDAKGLSQADLSLRTGLAEKTISQIINGIAPISYETSEKLELATGVPANFWNRRELSYRERMVRRAEQERHKENILWLKQVPVKVLVERQYIQSAPDKPEMVRRVLRFFGVSGIDSWQNTWADPAVQFRGKESQSRRPGYVAAWLRMGQLQADSIECEPFDSREFRRVLTGARELTVTPASTWQTQLPALCASAGVAVVFTREIPSAGVSGATKWLRKDMALIQLSLKYKTDDQLWFTFFHEAGHILLHGKRQMFLEFADQDETEEELEANRFARDMLIPPSVAYRLPLLKSKESIRQFAASINIAPGIVVGRLQHDEFLLPKYCNDLKRKLLWGPVANGS